jgi:uncharacterized protein YciI
MILLVEFLCYHRDRAGSGDLRFALRESHWAYMDRFADRMIARGPTFDGETLTGSLHLLDLPDPAAARAFAFEEPGYQAGAYRDVLIRRWENRLGRTMWDFPAGREGGPYFLVLGLGDGPAADLDPPGDPDPRPIAAQRLVAYGPLLSDDGARWLGTAALVNADSPAEARLVLTAGRYAGIEVHAWAFGGRPG